MRSRQTTLTETRFPYFSSSYPLPISYIKKQVLRQLYPNKIFHFRIISNGINWLNSSPWFGYNVLFLCKSKLEVYNNHKMLLFSINILIIIIITKYKISKISKLIFISFWRKASWFHFFHQFNPFKIKKKIEICRFIMNVVCLLRSLLNSLLL